MSRKDPRVGDQYDTGFGLATIEAIGPDPLFPEQPAITVTINNPRRPHTLSIQVRALKRVKGVWTIPVARGD